MTAGDGLSFETAVDSAGAGIRGRHVGVRHVKAGYRTLKPASGTTGPTEMTAREEDSFYN